MRHFSVAVFCALIDIFVRIECRIRNNIDDWDEDGMKKLFELILNL